MAPPAAPTALHHRTPLLLPRRTVALGATATARAARAASLAVRAQPDTTAAAGSTSAPEPTPEFKPPPGFKAPEPKRYEVKSGQVGSVLGASLAIPLRLGTGVFVLGYSPSLVSPSEIPSDQYALEFGAWKVKEESKIGQCKRPEKPIEIYEFEGCPFCRKVREMVTVLDLDVLFYPCPQKAQRSDLKSSKWVERNNSLTWRWNCSNYAITWSVDTGLATLGRIGKGNSYIASKVPPQPIEIWACEGSPFCKLVRETLVELELPHLLHSCARGSPKRQEFFKKKGLFQAPYIEDPNTGVQMFESAEIIDYLKATYALYPSS
ncbi:Thioredoxin family protein [Zea mays]|uniref:Thioredoxin family protein n=2 Tax=Zea mays TaxID=4577 RepID=A0A1D6KML1_MAIZE|nr:Thioredoxin family protein [Zea mays]